MRKILNDKGDVDTLKGIYDKVSAYHYNNYLSFLWPIHSKYRAVLFQLFDLIEIISATQEQYLIQAFEFVKKYRHTHRKYLPLEIDLSFMSQWWFYFVQKRKKGKSFVDRKALEVCVFSYLEQQLFLTDGTLLLDLVLSEYFDASFAFCLFR